MFRRGRVIRDSDPTIRVCPYQQSACKLPLNDDCPLSTRLRTITEPEKWRRESGRAFGCTAKGVDLDRRQYNAKKLGLMV